MRAIEIWGSASIPRGSLVGVMPSSAHNSRPTLPVCPKIKIFMGEFVARWVGRGQDGIWGKRRELLIKTLGIWGEAEGIINKNLGDLAVE